MIFQNGYYDETGNWQRTKFCFIDCGASCTCSPPNGQWYSAEYDKRAHHEFCDTMDINAEEIIKPCNCRGKV